MLSQVLCLPMRATLRFNAGYRQMAPARLLISSTFVFVLLPHVINLVVFWLPPSELNTPVLVVIAGAVVVLGLRHRLQHGQALAAGGGSDVHTMEVGRPLLLLAFPSLPLAFTSCVLDPLLCLGAGYAVTYVCMPLGVAVMLSGAALAAADGRVYLAERRRFLDAADGIVEAQRHARMSEHHYRKSEPRPDRSQGESTPTGAAAEDIDWHFRRRG